MQRITHITFAIFLAITFWAVFDFSLFVVIFAGIGAVIPDLDIKKGIRKYHRKLFHNIWFFGALFTLIFFTFGFMVALGFTIGLLSHLLADMLTPMGIYPFWPLGKNYSLNKYTGISTGGKAELYFDYVILTLAVFLFLLKSFSGNIWEAGGKEFLASGIATAILLVGIYKKEFLPDVYRED